MVKRRWIAGCNEGGTWLWYEQEAHDAYNRGLGCWETSWSWTGRTKLTAPYVEGDNNEHKRHKGN